ncbi:hypothetical protein C8R44DRAFT_795896 [Mycena epipterygia]|nr:hypothetical protein C8R44DRAFT_795896 [Mycena epipterygia]
MDNGTNNDTMIEVFEQKCNTQSIDSSAIDSRVRCMPHTAHLATIKASVSYITGFCAERKRRVVRVTLIRKPSQFLYPESMTSTGRVMKWMTRRVSMKEHSSSRCERRS